ncbi:hypothetical protein MICRO8M_20160 [Microbacterium sp. 8M]|uniref:CsbD family protein n=1 Tax=Microbacterium sp. 8M TaxID=2653153 RepID=UPI0012F02A2E|nr:CsbD family protein [Microbacterium sp. 8M]VXB58001.1 hypothetical protein MICRO8M_20160 [Microbacterium sp. 8M]
MALRDEARHRVEELSGRTKREIGRVLGDEDLEARGADEEERAKRERAIDKALEAADQAADDEEDEMGG